MRLCPKCQLEISQQALFCEHCGLRFAGGDLRASGTEVTANSPSTGRAASEKGAQDKASGQAPNALGSLVALVISAVVLYFLWTNFGYLLSTSSSDAGNAASSGSPPSTHTVRYVVDGNSFTKATGSVNVTMTNSSGGTEQDTVRTPWQKEFVAHSGLIVVLSATNSYDAGYASAEVYVDGVLLQKARSMGGVASVSGIVP